jgi:uncharacterized protein (DUF1697 family)
MKSKPTTTRYVAFLRGINVSGQKLIKMEELKTHFKQPGLNNISTYIQSGNVLFESGETDIDALRSKIEKNLEKKLGYKVTVIIRSFPQLEAIIGNNPFKDAELSGKSKIYVMMLSDKAPTDSHNKLCTYLSETEQVYVGDYEVYMLTDSYGNSKLSNTLVEKKLGVLATARNWNTMSKLLSL